MMIRASRFNTYLQMALCLLWAAGCQTAESKRQKMLSTLHFHLEVYSDGTDHNERVPIYRAQPMLVNVDKKPFLDEGRIIKAAVVEENGGFAIQVQFNRQGTWLLEEYSAANNGRHVAIFSDFGEKRWLGAPVFSRRIADGRFTFTPDATREEVDRIVLGLNNLGRELNQKAK